MNADRRLHEAIRAKNLRQISSALASGAGANLMIDGCPALILAASADHIEAVQLLLEAGADVNARDAVHGNTALREVAAEGSVDMARLLLSAGADPLIPGRMMLTARDRARERHTPEGRMILVAIEQQLQQRRQDRANPEKFPRRWPARR